MADIARSVEASEIFKTLMRKNVLTQEDLLANACRRIEDAVHFATPDLGGRGPAAPPNQDRSSLSAWAPRVFLSASASIMPPSRLNPPARDDLVTMTVGGHRSPTPRFVS